MSKWLFIREGRVPSRVNMQKDCDLFSRVVHGELGGFFRVYNWQTPAVTIGYHQKDFMPRDNQAIGLFRRPTGGGAVLHCDDITYSIASSEDGFWGRGIRDTYSRIAGIFLCAFHACGVGVRLCEQDPGFSEVCFARTARMELMLENQKIMGAAQVRRHGFFLQQGVLPLHVDRDLYQRIFGDQPVPAGITDLIPDFVPELLIGALRHELEAAAGIPFADGHE